MPSTDGDSAAHVAAFQPQPVRALFVIGALDGGGSERQMVELLKHLDRQRVAPHLLLTFGDGPLRSEVPADIPVFAFRPTRNLGWLDRWKARLRWWSYEFRSFVRSVLRKQAIEVVISKTLLASRDVHPACVAESVPHVIQAVGDPAHEWELYADVLPRGRAQVLPLYQSAALILANSRGLQQRIRTLYGLPDEHVAFLPNCYDFDRFDQAAQATTVSVRTDHWNVLSVGRLDANKNHHLVLRALEQVQRTRPDIPWTWHILGTGPLADALRSDVIAAGFQNRVRFHGFVANPHPWYRVDGVFVLSSQSEGSPNVLVEALAHALPVIATDCPSGPRELLADGRWGSLIPGNDVPAMAAAIITAYDERVTQRERAQAAAHNIRREYAPERTVRELERWLHRIARRT